MGVNRYVPSKESRNVSLKSFGAYICRISMVVAGKEAGSGNGGRGRETWSTNRGL